MKPGKRIESISEVIVRIAKECMDRSPTEVIKSRVFEILKSTERVKALKIIEASIDHRLNIQHLFTEADVELFLMADVFKTLPEVGRNDRMEVHRSLMKIREPILSVITKLQNYEGRNLKETGYTKEQVTEKINALSESLEEILKELRKF